MRCCCGNERVTSAFAACLHHIAAAVVASHLCWISDLDFAYNGCPVGGCAAVVLVVGPVPRDSVVAAGCLDPYRLVDSLACGIEWLDPRGRLRHMRVDCPPVLAVPIYRFSILPSRVAAVVAVAAGVALAAMMVDEEVCTAAFRYALLPPLQMESEQIQA
jgi:hypothetical protein